MTPTPAVLAQLDRETHFWLTDPHERPGVDSLANFVNKTQDAAIFSAIVDAHNAHFTRATRVVELGGGQGWASCMVKRRFPGAHVTLSDGVPEAVAGHTIWERVFDVRLDAVVAAPAQAIPVADASVDVLFMFAAAHHLVDYRGALQEAARVLAPDGRCIWCYEPTAPRYLHRLAERRVNAKRPDVPEHVLLPAEVRALARECGLTCEWTYFPSIVHRSPSATAYYLALRALPFLCRLLPCTANIVFSRARSPSAHGTR